MPPTRVLTTLYSSVKITNEHGDQHHFHNGEDGDGAQHSAQREHVGQVESASVQASGRHNLRNLAEYTDHIKQHPYDRGGNDLNIATAMDSMNVTLATDQASTRVSDKLMRRALGALRRRCRTHGSGGT